MSRFVPGPALYAAAARRRRFRAAAKSAAFILFILAMVAGIEVMIAKLLIESGFVFTY